MDDSNPTPCRNSSVHKLGLYSNLLDAEHFTGSSVDRLSQQLMISIKTLLFNF